MDGFSVPSNSKHFDRNFVPRRSRIYLFFHELFSTDLNREIILLGQKCVYNKHKNLQLIEKYFYFVNPLKFSFPQHSILLSYHIRSSENSTEEE